MNLLVEMVEHHVWLTGEMVERAARSTTTSPRQADRASPSKASTTSRHCASCCRGWSARWTCGTPRIASRDYDWSVEEHENGRLDARGGSPSGPAFLDQVRRVVEGGRLDETFIDAQCEPAEVYTYGGMIAHVLTFAAHRRILVAGALIDAGITDLGAGDPRLWVAQDAA